MFVRGGGRRLTNTPAPRHRRNMLANDRSSWLQAAPDGSVEVALNNSASI
jgi:hypothetical protein